MATCTSRSIGRHDASGIANPMKPFIVIAVALCVIMAGATLASPLYPIYAKSWGISSSGITVAYSAYMAGALLALLTLGHLSVSAGYVYALRIAVLLILVGLAISAGADSLPTLSIGRFVIGVAAGIGSSAAPSGLIALEPPGRTRRAPLVGSATTIAGLGLGPLAGGLLAQLLPQPLLVPYLFFGLMALLAGAMLIALPADGPARSIRGFRPALRFHMPTDETAHPFLLASISVFMGYTLLSLFASLAPSFFAQLFPWHGPAISGVGVATMFAGSALSQILFRKMRSRHGLSFGSLTVGASVVLLALSIWWRSGILFIASDLIGGLGQGLGFMSGLALINRIASNERKSRTIASFFTWAYLGGIVPIVGVGLLSDRIGLPVSVTGVCGVLAIFSVALGLIAHHSGHASLREERRP